jgi:hypothetical protein
MKLLKDLGMRDLVSKKGNHYRKRFGLYECPECLNKFEMFCSVVTKGKSKRCKTCSSRDHRTSHGKSKTSMYSRWSMMKTRCTNPNFKQYKDYGGRGITVCKEWLNDYAAYEKYVMSLPNAKSPGYSVDRIDNDGDYEPGNIKWSTRSEQNNNKRCYNKTVKV